MTILTTYMYDKRRKLLRLQQPQHPVRQEGTGAGQGQQDISTLANQVERTSRDSLTVLPRLAPPARERNPGKGQPPRSNPRLRPLPRSGNPKRLGLLHKPVDGHSKKVAGQFSPPGTRVAAVSRPNSRYNKRISAQVHISFFLDAAHPAWGGARPSWVFPPIYQEAVCRPVGFETP